MGYVSDLIEILGRNPTILQYGVGLESEREVNTTSSIYHIIKRKSKVSTKCHILPYPVPGSVLFIPSLPYRIRFVNAFASITLVCLPGGCSHIIVPSTHPWVPSLDVVISHQQHLVLPRTSIPYWTDLLSQPLSSLLPLTLLLCFPSFLQ